MAEKKYVIDNAELMAEWNWEKNNELGFEPKLLTVGSGKKVWWKCLKGHEWQALISNRNKGTSCPCCAGQKVIKGYNDLGIVNPRLAQEWNYEKNGALKPEDFTESSGKRVWWKCNKGHEWQARIADRNTGHGCPYCSNRYIIKGENDLQTANPTLANEWNYEKNENLKPENFTANSGKRAWWKCRKGHEWQATIVSRNRGNGCPICSSEQRTSFPEYAIVYYLSKYGFEKVIFNDINPEMIDALKANLEINDISDGYEIYNESFEDLKIDDVDLCVIDAFPGADISKIKEKADEMAHNVIVI